MTFPVTTACAFDAAEVEKVASFRTIYISRSSAATASLICAVPPNWSANFLTFTK
jgi:hypothetical protein